MTAAASITPIDSPEDARLPQLAALLSATFNDSNTTLGLDRLREFLAANRPAASRRFCILVATLPELRDRVVGGTVFSYVVGSNCGFSEYLLAEPAARGQGLGRRLVDHRKQVLDATARAYGQAACRGVFIEVDHPDRAPRASGPDALDGWARWRLFDHLGFRRVDVRYVQPALAQHKRPVEYMDLLFAAWDAQARQASRLPAWWLLETLAPIWSAWSPATAAAHLARLRNQVGSGDVGLEPITAPLPHSASSSS